MMRRILQIESLRGFAASYVFAGHLVFEMFGKQSTIALPLRFGQEMVMIFFLISGFVIAWSMEVSADKRFSRYFRHRFFRIYPIFLLSLLLTVALSPTGVSGLFTGGPYSFGNLIGNIFMLQDLPLGKPGIIAETYGDNWALWSLSYEWWFYMLFFPLWRFVPERHQLPLVSIAGLAATVLYNIFTFQPLLFFAYFPIWWCGAELGRSFVRNGTLPFGKVLIALAIAVFGFATFIVPDMLQHHPIELGSHPLLEARHAATALVLVLMLRVLWNNDLGRWASRIGAPWAMLAPISYGLYALHDPIVHSLNRLNEPVMVKVVMAIAATLAVAWFAEIPFQRRVLAIWKVVAQRSQRQYLAEP